MKATTSFAVLTILLAPFVVNAQDNQASSADGDCATYYEQVFRRIHPESPALSDAEKKHACHILAVAIRAELGSAGRTTMPSMTPELGDLQATREAAAGMAGGPAQGTSVATTEPVEQGGATLSTAGTSSGMTTLLSLAINPTVFTSVGASAFASAARFADASLIVPLEDVDEDSNGVVDYAGLRLRLNFSGLERGSQLYQDVLQAYSDVLRSTGEEIRQIETFVSQPGRANCIEALLNGRFDETTRECGAAFIRQDPSLVERLAERIQAARVKADDRYFGADIRADFGNLQLGGIDSIHGTSIYAGVAYGVRNTDDDGRGSTGLRTHIGAQYLLPQADSTESVTASFAGDIAIGLEMIRYFGSQRLTLSTGAEARWSPKPNDSSEAARIADRSLNFGRVRASLTIPILEGTSISMNLSIPLWGASGPTLSVGGNWRLLLAGLRPNRMLSL